MMLSLPGRRGREREGEMEASKVYCQYDMASSHTQRTSDQICCWCCWCCVAQQHVERVGAVVADKVKNRVPSFSYGANRLASNNVATFINISSVAAAQIHAIFYLCASPLIPTPHSRVHTPRNTELACYLSVRPAGATRDTRCVRYDRRNLRTRHRHIIVHCFCPSFDKSSVCCWFSMSHLRMLIARRFINAILYAL